MKLNYQCSMFIHEYTPTHTHTHTQTGYSTGTAASATMSQTMGGECLMGLKLAISIADNPTSEW